MDYRDYKLTREYICKYEQWYLDYFHLKAPTKIDVKFWYKMPDCRAYRFNYYSAELKKQIADIFPFKQLIRLLTK